MFDCSYRNGLFFATIHLLNFHLFPDFFEDVFLVALLILLLMLHCQSKLWDLHKKMWGDQGDLTFCLIIKSIHHRVFFRRQKLNQKMFSIGGDWWMRRKYYHFIDSASLLWLVIDLLPKRWQFLVQFIYTVTIKILQQTIQYPMLEFEPTTSSTQVVSRNH